MDIRINNLVKLCVFINVDQFHGNFSKFLRSENVLKKSLGKKTIDFGIEFNRLA